MKIVRHENIYRNPATDWLVVRDGSNGIEWLMYAGTLQGCERFIADQLERTEQATLWRKTKPKL